MLDYYSLSRLAKLPPERPPVVLLGGLNVVRALGLAHIPVVLAAHDMDEPGLHSRHCTARWILPALSNEEAVVDSLVALAMHLRKVFRAPAPLFYSNDDYLRLVSTHRARLQGRFQLMLNDDDTTLALLDKQRFAQFAARRRLPVPASLSWDGNAAGSLAACARPVLVKPASKIGTGSMPELVALFDSSKALVRPDGMAVRSAPEMARLHPYLVFHEYVPGDDRELWCFDGVADGESRVIACHTGRKLRCAPPLTGESSYVELVPNAALEAVAREAAAAAGLKGIFNMDFKRDPQTGRFYLLEINARCNLWLYVGAKNGLNLAKVLYGYMTTGRAPAATAWRPRYRWLDFAMDRAAFRALSAEGRITRARWLASLAAPKVYALFAWHDPAPMLHRLVGKVLRRMRLGAAWTPRRAKA